MPSYSSGPFGPTGPIIDYERNGYWETQFIPMETVLSLQIEQDRLNRLHLEKQKLERLLIELKNQINPSAYTCGMDYSVDCFESKVVEEKKELKVKDGVSPIKKWKPKLTEFKSSL